MAREQDGRTFIGAVVDPGTRLNGIYEIEALVAAGGMGEVYRARAIQTGDAVAIKMLRPEMARDDRALALFRKEATALRKLCHEAIVRYYVFSVDPTLGAPYLAMEFVDGRSLAELLGRGPLDFEAVGVLRRRLAEGLQAAHDLGIVHRDVSPDNVILPGGDVARAKIVDFGIARSRSVEGTTIIGAAFAGKHLYVSPEQLGLFGGDVGPRSDIYGLGLVLAQALAGRALDMGGSPAERLAKRRRVPDLAGIDRRMRPLLRRMLQPDPADRIASMAQVAAWQPSAYPAARRLAPVAAGLLAAAALGAAAMLARTGGDAADAGAPGGAVRTAAIPDALAEEERALAAEFQERLRAEEARRAAERQHEQRIAEEELRLGSPRSAAPAPAPRGALLWDAVAAYPAGACVHLFPQDAAGPDPRVDAFATAPGAFADFLQAFRTAHGFAPRLVPRPVTAAQCSAVAFLRSLAPQLAGALRLTLGATRLAPDAGLSGSLEGHGDRRLELLLVADDGRVHSLSDALWRSGGTAGFSTRLDGRPRPGPRPQLVLALATDRDLAPLHASLPVPGDDLFPRLVDAIRTSGAAVDLAVGYVEVDR